MSMTHSFEWSLYIDGSCLENQHVHAQTPAAWAVVVVVGDTGLGKGTGEIHQEFSGMVVTEQGADDFIGAEVGSNNTAELSAFAHALRWLLVEGGSSAAVIQTDSQYAGNLACGAWKASANKALVQHVQRLWDEVTGLRPIEWKHVRAHRGHRWNERADHLARRKVSGQLPESLSFWKPGQR